MTDETLIVNTLVRLTKNGHIEWTYHLHYNLTKYDTVTIMVFDDGYMMINAEKFNITEHNLINLLTVIDGSYEQDDNIQDTLKRILGW